MQNFEEHELDGLQTPRTESSTVSQTEQKSLFEEEENAPKTSCLSKLKFWGPRTLTSRKFTLDGLKRKSNFCPNIVRNQRYSVITFFPKVLFEMFAQFYNATFLFVCVAQFYEPLRVGYMIGVLLPLIFVVSVTCFKEAFDDFTKFLRDREANSEKVEKLTPTGIEIIKSSQIQVGDVLMIHKDQKVPADMVFLRTSDKSGSVFIRTDQLDGETDWKLRIAVSSSQNYKSDEEIFHIAPEVFAEKPTKAIYEFLGTMHSNGKSESLSLENTLWMNCVLASVDAIGCVVYTGQDTRAMMNQSQPKTKLGIIEKDIRNLVFVLMAMTVALSLAMIFCRGFHGVWIIYFLRYFILFSAIVPLTLRTNIDVGRIFYKYALDRDPKLPGVIMRTTTIPEELGRISYLLSDKTGTLTKNDMELKKLHLGTILYSDDSEMEARQEIIDYINEKHVQSKASKRGKRDFSGRLFETVMCLAICHNVTPDIGEDGKVSYQASSPDEIAIVNWTEKLGVLLYNRTRTTITIRLPNNEFSKFDILYNFPFTSESKRMGIVVQNIDTKKIMFIQKGADSIMSQIVHSNNWLDEECGNMAREGLRTLVIGKKNLTTEELEEFKSAYEEANLNLTDRKSQIQKVVSKHLESELELLGITGVEDKLQDDVKLSLETLRNAGIKVWMLTGDKVETATCIAVSTKLVSRSQRIVPLENIQNSPEEAEKGLAKIRGNLNTCLVIDGKSLQVMLDHFPIEFITLATKLPSVVCCRCSPTQKAEIAALVKKVTKKRVCCIGDGGNDVSMIQEGNLGVGIVGKEGLQASLAADFSITQFNQIVRLLLWHGRNCYRRTSKLTLFVFHRGIIISIMQAIFSAMFNFTPICIFHSSLLAGYATVYTNFSVFSLVWDLDVSENVALMYPELYKDLVKGRSLSFKKFMIWVAVSVYQGSVICILAFLLFKDDLFDIRSIVFTALIANELLMVAVSIHTWCWIMIVALFVSVGFYITSIKFINFAINLDFVSTFNFHLMLAIMTLAAISPIFLFHLVRRRYSPAAYSKLKI